MDLDNEELKETNPEIKDKEIKILKERIKVLELELNFYKELYYGEKYYKN